MAFFVAGCSWEEASNAPVSSWFTYNVPASQPLPGRPLVERLPVTVAVHYPPGFRDFVEEWKPAGSYRTVRVPIGEMSVKMFDTVLPSLFDVVPQREATPPPGPVLSGVTAVVEISLERFVLEIASAGQIPLTFIADLEYRIRVLDPGGGERVSWTFGAETEVRGYLYSNSEVRITRAAMRQAAASLLTEYCCQEDFLAWLREVGVTPPECVRPCDSR
jgi:hypothetical protein